jgi:FlaG/FlaF family flagellin (archaellin)
MKNRKNAGISAVSGVIFMVVITITLAAAVFIYVESLRDVQNNGENLCVEGWVTGIDTNLTIPFGNESVDVWHVTLSDDLAGSTGHMYQMIFDGLLPPLEGDNIRLSYEFYLYNNTKYFRVYDVVEL